MCAKIKSEIRFPKPVREKIQLGIANAWTTIPDLVKQCKHQIISQKISRCYHQYSCDTCNYVYTVDSSD